MARVILLNKPWGVLSQFTDAEHRVTLADYVDVPGIYPAGRLDRDSEGLLVLTNDGALQHRIAHPRAKMSKTYWAQVEGDPDESDLDGLRDGKLVLKDGPCQAAKATLIEAPASLWPRNPPVRVRKTVPDRWVSLTILEGRNRQVRRMLAAVGFPVLRLIRYRVGSWTLDGIASGHWLEVSS
ncbi:MAG: pseudouridine synthase [Pseudomonadota bacterium]